MYRISLMAAKYYAVKITDCVDDLQDDAENVFELVTQGTPVLYVSDLETAAEVCNCDEDDIVVVD